jgi:predicted metalloprotease
MRWSDQRQSDNVEDRRGQRAGFGGARMGGMGIGGLLILMLFGYLIGGDPMALLRDSGQVSTGVQSGAEPGGPSAPPTDEAGQFVRAVLGSTEDVWNALFKQAGSSYTEPRLVLFSDAVQSACGMASAAVGPFYCPPDQQVYIDLGFFRELDSRFGAPGDFAQAYVVAHEVGHHVQTLLGISDRNMAARQRASEAEANALSVRQELQADCFAGIWAHSADRSRQLLEAGDIEEGLNAASAIGDDRMQKQARGYVSPESFTHGSSEQRVRWFKRGFESGQTESCDTFATRTL